MLRFQSAWSRRHSLATSSSFSSLVTASIPACAENTFHPRLIPAHAENTHNLKDSLKVIASDQRPKSARRSTPQGYARTAWHSTASPGRRSDRLRIDAQFGLDQPQPDETATAMSGIAVQNLAAQLPSDAVPSEVHAPPYTRLTALPGVLHFVFLSGDDEAATDQRRFVDFCRARGLPAPDASTKHHQVSIGSVLRWEQRSEFATCIWIWDDTDKTPRQYGIIFLGQIA